MDKSSTNCPVNELKRPRQQQNRRRRNDQCVRHRHHGTYCAFIVWQPIGLAM